MKTAGKPFSLLPALSLHLLYRLRLPPPTPRIHLNTISGSSDSSPDVDTDYRPKKELICSPTTCHCREGELKVHLHLASPLGPSLPSVTMYPVDVVADTPTPLPDQGGGSALTETVDILVWTTTRDRRFQAIGHVDCVGNIADHQYDQLKLTRSPTICKRHPTIFPEQLLNS